MNNSRIIGNNIALELKAANRTDYSKFAEEIGFSLANVHKLLEGRLFLPPFQLRRIAEALKVPTDALLRNRGVEEYSSLVDNFRNFQNEKNQELVLDLIDMYADLEEAL